MGSQPFLGSKLAKEQTLSLSSYPKLPLKFRHSWLVATQKSLKRRPEQISIRRPGQYAWQIMLTPGQPISTVQL